ncbi:DUF975 family protein [Clostridium sp. AM58-1XD]|uniref:DUF975 family protein n=1 Tax=Clostridium sp. AM58-1XD TaxID=2292307 RepID=UPI000E4B4769|nr:DUF975 family protein [Clostridium sp. AM58-1XD]RGY97263.1 DUF975 family protein [Clostridium sp. AM58-1XD]
MIEKKTPAELKQMARQVLRGNYGICAGSLVLIGIAVMMICFMGEIPVAITMALSGSAGGFGMAVVASSGFMIFIIVIGLLEYIVMIGYMRLCYNICTGGERNLGDLFFGFNHHLWKFVRLGLLFIVLPQVLNIPVTFLRIVGAAAARHFVFLSVFSIIMTILQVVVSMYLLLNFSMAAMILVENPEKGLMDSLKESSQIMKGNKGRMFWLWLTFLGVVLLGYGSCGIGFIWIMPYMTCTHVFFYFDITDRAVVEQKKDVEWDGVQM